MTVKDVAQYLRMGESTVYKLAKSGKLPGRKIGGSWRFSLQALNNWLEVNYHSNHGNH
jgi:excisionase family DNA binding protein